MIQKKVTGYCEVQKKDATIFIDVVDANCLEDTNKGRNSLGRHHCDYAKSHFDGRCNSCKLRNLA